MLPTLKLITMNSNASNDLKLLIYDFYKNPLKQIYLFKNPTFGIIIQKHHSTLIISYLNRFRKKVLAIKY